MRPVKRDAMGCRFGKVIDYDSIESTNRKRSIASLELRNKVLEKAKREDDLYFAMTELLRRIEIGHEVGVDDLPEQLRAEFERGMNDGSLAGFLQSCEAWWTMPPFVPRAQTSVGGTPAAPPSSSGLPRSDYESISMLTFNGGATAEYLWAQDIREVTVRAYPARQYDCAELSTSPAYSPAYSIIKRPALFISSKSAQLASV
jgi:hypothetical protein